MFLKKHRKNKCVIPKNILELKKIINITNKQQVQLPKDDNNGSYKYEKRKAAYRFV